MKIRTCSIINICVTLVVTILFVRLLVIKSQALDESGSHTNVTKSECYCESELSRRKYDVEGGWKYDKGKLN